jgi:hypothetical protein
MGTAAAAVKAAANGKGADQVAAVFDLDALEREAHPGPLVVRLAGREMVLKDLLEMDWTEAFHLDLDDADQVLSTLMEPDDLEALRSGAVPLWKLLELAKRINAHYAPLLASLGEDAASPGS